MIRWVYALLAWLFVIGVHLALPESPRSEYLLKIRLRATLQWLGWLAITASGALVLVGIAGAFLPTLLPPEFGDDQWHDVPLGLAVLAACAAFATLWRDADLVVSDRGIHYFRAFVPWSEVTGLEMKGSVLRVTAARRRLWNAWTGRLAMWTGWWRVSPADRQQLLAIAHPRVSSDQ